MYIPMLELLPLLKMLSFLGFEDSGFELVLVLCLSEVGQPSSSVVISSLFDVTRLEDVERLKPKEFDRACMSLAVGGQQGVTTE